MKRNGKFLVAIASLALITACNKAEKKQIQENSNEPKKAVESNQFSKEQLVGNWVQPNPINSKEVQGFSLLENGTAKSINMATLLYEKWWLDNNELFLVTTSIGNHTKSTDTLPYKIIKLDSSNLSIQYKSDSDQMVEEYTKK
ncbi:lipocalin family protein [Flavobacterium sp. LS1R47]|uniref:Lipocalin family protein n=1 Tax=Flavobacterium frigoritolerans TaxID=2987686 RepID=A0A9X3C9L6_9FLAO|nr:lipocalin family protein [Flavobacterium frigoritolerans]MCV9934129.1 lipocalin family protein [Flavobacterium frigoritolerans]